MRLGELSHERRAVGAAGLRLPSGAGTAPCFGHHHGAVARVHGPRLSRCAPGWHLALADRRDGDPEHARRYAGAQGRTCREPVLPAFCARGRLGPAQAGSGRAHLRRDRDARARLPRQPDRLQRAVARRPRARLRPRRRRHLPRRAHAGSALVNTVKGFAQQEKDVLTQVTAARSRVGSIQATPELVDNPEAFARFQAAQRELGGALSRLLAVAESYPQLKSDANFRDLQAQLEGTENRIAVARNRYIRAVQEYNVTVRSFPSNLTAMLFGFKPKPNFTVENEQEIAKPPRVDFGTKNK